jgi:flagellum-specific peptidoglycan hydrolase FlgJ
MTRDEFIAQAKCAAMKTCAESGFSVGITVAQAALESNFGESQLSRTANNYFGIKAHGKHAAIEFRTNESGAKGDQQVVARFAAYDGMEECFECRNHLIANSPVYAEARAAKGDPVRFVTEMGKHWATDPKYAEKVLRIYTENGFHRFDQQ